MEFMRIDGTYGKDGKLIMKVKYGGNEGLKRLREFEIKWKEEMNLKGCVF